MAKKVAAKGGSFVPPLDSFEPARGDEPTEAAKPVEYGYSKVCPRCKMKDTAAVSGGKDGMQRRRCRRPICGERYKAIGVQI